VIQGEQTLAMTWFHIMDDQASGRSAKVSSEAAADWVELEHRELLISASPTMHKKTFLLLQLLSTTSSSSAHLSRLQN